MEQLIFFKLMSFFEIFNFIEIKNKKNNLEILNFFI